MAELTIRVDVPIEIKKEGTWYIAGSQPLDVYSQGKTVKEATKNIVEALNLFFVTCFEMGTLEDVLKEAGFKVSKVKTPTRKQPSQEKLVHVPIPFVCANELAKCHV